MEGAICFGCCDRFWGLGVRSLFEDVRMRSLFGMWECDRFWGVGIRSLLGFGRAIAVGVWECDRFEDVGERSL